MLKETKLFTQINLPLMKLLRLPPWYDDPNNESRSWDSPTCLDWFLLKQAHVLPIDVIFSWFTLKAYLNVSISGDRCKVIVVRAWRKAWPRTMVVMGYRMENQFTNLQRNYATTICVSDQDEIIPVHTYGPWTQTPSWLSQEACGFAL